MKKLLTFFLTALLAFSVGWATEESFVFSTMGYGNGDEVTTVTGENVTITFNKGTNSNTPKYYTTGTAVRCYGGNYFIVSCSKTISEIVLTFGSGDGSNAITTDVVTYNNGTWTGSASSVKFTIGGSSGQRRIASIKVTYSAGSTPVEPNVYKKVTSPVDLVAGKKYIVVNESNGVGMGELNSSRFGVGITGLDIDDNKVDIGGLDVMEMTLGGTTDAWTFRMGDNGNYLSDSDNNTYTFFSSGSVGNSSTDITKWAITPGANTSIRSNYVTSQYIRYNSSGYFGTYASNVQSPVALYVKYEGSVANPTISPNGGDFVAAQTVNITCSTPDAVIYYTTDGSTPSVTNGTLYNGAITVSETTTIKAIAIAPAMDDSEVVSETYTIDTSGAIYRKVTSDEALTTGDYLIVYENGSLVFDGSRTALDAVSNTQPVTITDHTIRTSQPIYFTYNKAAGTLKSASGYYIGQTGTGNGLQSSQTVIYTNTITFDGSGNAVITSSGGPTLRYNSASNQTRFRYYGSGQQAIQLYKKDSNDPTLLATPTTLALTDIPYDGSSTSGTIHVAGTHLTDDVTVSVNGADFSVSPTSISPVNETVDENITVTYSGSSTTEVTATVTITCGDLTETVTVTAKKATPPPATLTVNPSILTIDDSGTNNTFTVEGSYLGSDNVGLTQTNNKFIPTLSTTTGSTYSGDNYQGFTPAGGSLNGTVAMSYTGLELSANTTVTLANNVANATVDVNYVADLYIVTDNGVTNDWHFDGTYSEHMTYDDGVYTAVFTAENPNTFILFARKLGDGVTWNTRYVFGPSSGGDWWLPESGNGNGTIDLNTSHPIKIQGAGTYIVTINANNNTFTITKRVLSGDEFVLVTDTENVTTDSEYVLVYSDIAAMGKTLSGSTSGYLNHETSGFEVEHDVVTLTSDSEVNVFTLIEVDEYFYILDSNGKYIGTNGNNLALADEANGDAYKWSITIANNLAIMVNKANNRYLAYNTTAPRFTTYASITAGSAQQYAALYKRGGTVGPVAPHAPVISPASGRYAEDQLVTITCSTSGTTIYYTVNGGETQTYTAPFTVDVDEDHTQTTIVAWAEKDDLTSDQVTVTYTFKSDKVNSIAEFLELEYGEEVTFNNPVVVLFDYSQNSAGGQEYIWVKDRTGYTQLFITPQFDAASVADPQYNNYGQFVPKYENGDVIPAGFKVKKNYFGNGQYDQAMCADAHSTFEIATDKALADPEQVTLSELLANPAHYNNRYLYINKLQVSDVSGLNFSVSADENDDNVSEVQGGTAIVGYNKYNSPAWKNKQGEVIGVTLPTNNAYYNVKFIFQKWSNGYEIMPIEFTPWQDASLRLEDLVEIGEQDQNYTISNPLIATAVTWDADNEMFAIFAKDDEMYAQKSAPAAGVKDYLISFENQDGSFVNTVEQKDYDQSNWIEILIPTEIIGKIADPNAYQLKLDELKERYENKILKAGTVKGTYIDTLNPTIRTNDSNVPQVESTSVYTPNIYCTANFLMENLSDEGATSYRDDEFGGQYFMMDGKPQEFCKVVWAYYEHVDDYFVSPAQEGDTINGHNFHGSFKADMSLCEDSWVVEKSPLLYFTPSNETTPEKLFGFKAIVRKNPNSTVWSNGRNGGPQRIQPSTESPKENNPAYIVYPLNSEASSSDVVTAVHELEGAKDVVSVRYYNLMGVESEKPFEGINIVVTRYADGSISSSKIMR